MQDLITGDDFMALDAGHHQLAIQMYTETIKRIELQQATTLLPAAALQLSQEHGQALTLRQMHEQRLVELQEMGGATLAVA
jgi:hypothetical protein